MPPRVHILVLLACAVGMLTIPASTAVGRTGTAPDPASRQAEFDHIPASCSQPVDAAWTQQVDSIRWVAYSSPNPDPAGGYYRPDAEAVRGDLQVLRKAGFMGLITYASVGVMGKQIVSIAAELGYKGILMGIWSPDGQDEINNAVAAASSPIVLGYSIGNEGLGDDRPRYSVAELCAAIASLRQATGKPVTTSEDIEYYYLWPQLANVGDWLFAISHPYWHFTKHAPDAVRWEQEQYAAIVDRTDRYVFFKEVGLPTAGAPGLSEFNQDNYYRGLEGTSVRFAYFEGFDQPSKTGASVEPHWGIFNSDLTPKLLGWNLMGYRVFSGPEASTAWNFDCIAGGTCKVHPVGMLLFLGDDRGGLQHEFLAAFNTSGLPDDAVVLAAKLRIRSAGVVGRDPLTNRRMLVIDVCTPRDALEVSHPIAASPQLGDCLGAGALLDGPPNSGWYTIDVLPAALPFINLEGGTQFRFYLSGPRVDSESRSYIRFFSADAAEEDSPVLLVRYRLP